MLFLIFLMNCFIKKLLKVRSDLSESHLWNVLQLETTANIFMSIYKRYFYHIFWLRLPSSPSKGFTDHVLVILSLCYRSNSINGFSSEEDLKDNLGNMVPVIDEMGWKLLF